MGFSKKIKDEVKRKAYYQCCICRNYRFVDVHHIVPLKEEGTDDIDNAVSLCPNCHRDYGNDPEKRDTIKKMRDIWYERCEKREMNPAMEAFSKKLDDILTEIKKVKANQAGYRLRFQEMKDLVSKSYSKQAEAITVVDTMEELITISGTGDIVVPSEDDKHRGSMMILCEDCGHICESGDKFCWNCGSLLI